MDKKRSLLNVIVSMAFKIILLVVSILVRRYLIQYIGNEVNGLNSLYLSIIGFLAVAELGVGSAITFCMYKPIVDGNKDKVSALYHLFTKLYLIIGAIILVAGCILLPFLKYFAADYQNIDQNLYLTFFLMLASVVITYLFSSKTSLINAYKNNYITTTISSSGMLLQYGMQIGVLILTRSFVWYLVCRIVAAALQWGVTEIIARKKHGEIIRNKQRIDGETKQQVTKSVKAMFMHKIGGVLVNTADSLIISAFIGVVILGKYSNYTVIMTSMTGVITLFFTPLTSVIGHMCVQEDTTSVKRYLNFFHSFNFVVGIIFFLGYYAIIDNLVTLCFGNDLTLSWQIPFIITLNYFIQFMRQATLLFRDATGTFYNDRWKPLFEGVLNVGLSIGCIFLFSFLFGEDYAVVGVIVATIITNLTICHVVEPHVLYKYGMKSRATKYYLRNYIYIAIFAAALVALHFCMRTYGNEWKELLINGSIAIGIALVPSIAVMLIDKDFRHYFTGILRKIRNKLKRKGSETAPEEHNMRKMSLREVQLAELDILVEFDRICRENGLRYSLAGGTLLGAIRHKGFIPWDDDIDVSMPRQDYEKFREIFSELSSETLALTNDRGKDALYPFLKLYDRRIIVKEEVFYDVENLFIDVFPADGLPSDDKELAEIYRKSSKYRKIVGFCRLKNVNSYHGKHNKFFVRLTRLYAKIYGEKRAIRKLNELAKKYDYNASEYVGVLAWGCYGIGERILKSGYETLTEKEFEGKHLCAMSCWDDYLKGLYGDYMELPPEDKRVTHSITAYAQEEDV